MNRKKRNRNMFPEATDGNPYRGILYFTIADKFTVAGLVDERFGTLEASIAARDEHESKTEAEKKAKLDAWKEAKHAAYLAEFDPSLAFDAEVTR